MRIAVIPGDGIGVETTAEAVKAIRAVGDVFGRQFDLEMLPWGADYFLQTGVTIPPDGYAMLRDQFDAIFIGALGDPRVPDNRHARDILLGTRFELDLYVNYRPVKLLDARLCPLKDRTTGRRELRGVPREHRRALRQHRRTVQGRDRGRGRDSGRAQHLQGRPSHHQARLRVRQGERPPQRVHDRQEQRDGAGARAVAARVQGDRAAVSGHRGAPSLHRRAGAAADPEPGAVRRHRHQQPVRRHHHRPRRRAAGRARAWRRPATCIPARRRCSSRCTDRRRRWPGRTSRTRWARSCRPR